MNLPARTPIPQDLRQPDHGGATDPQIKYIADLRQKRQFKNAEHAAAFDARLAALSEAGQLTKSKASDIIVFLKTLPQRRVAAVSEVVDASTRPAIPPADRLPTGRYAVPSLDGELRFYRVWRGTRNPSYVKLYLQHGPDESEVPYGPTMIAKLSQIAEDAGNAAIRYGREIGVCSQCGKRLTNRLSRELAIGPVCGGRVFNAEAWSDRKADARAAIVARGEDPNETIEWTPPVEQQWTRLDSEPVAADTDDDNPF